MEWIRVPAHLTSVSHRHRPAKVLPRYEPGMGIDIDRLPAVMDASHLPPVRLDLDLVEDPTSGRSGYLVAHCQLCDIMYYNPDWWQVGRDHPRVMPGLRKRFQGSGTQPLWKE